MFAHIEAAMADADNRRPAGNRVILTDAEIDRLLDRLAGSKDPADRMIVSKLLSFRPGHVYVPVPKE